MKDSTHPGASPLVAVMVGVGLVVSGWYVASRGDGPAAQLGWVLVAAGVVAVVLNAGLLVVLRRRRG